MITFSLGHSLAWTAVENLASTTPKVLQGRKKTLWEMVGGFYDNIYGEKVDKYFNIRTFTAVILKGIEYHLHCRTHLKPESRRAKTCFETPNPP